MTVLAHLLKYLSVSHKRQLIWYRGRYDMNNEERLALADRVQQIIQNKQPQYLIYKEKEKIEKELSREKYWCGEWERISSMKSIWRKYKVWLLIAVFYTIYGIVKSLKILKPKLSHWRDRSSASGGSPHRWKMFWRCLARQATSISKSGSRRLEFIELHQTESLFEIWNAQFTPGIMTFTTLT